MIFRPIHTLAPACLGFLAVIAPCSIQPARAQAVTECPLIRSTQGDKIVVGDVRGATTPNSELQRMRVEAAMNMQTVFGDDIGVKVVFCSNRHPQESTFDRSRSDVLNDLGVVVEVWGEIEQDASLLSYAVIPVRIHEYYGVNNALTGFYRAVYQARAGGDQTRELQALFSDASELRAFAALALGVKNRQLAGGNAARKEKAQYYDNARTFFCRSVALLTEARQKGLRGLKESEWRALSTFAENSAREVARKAVGDPAYEGALKLVLDPQRLDRC